MQQSIFLLLFLLTTNFSFSQRQAPKTELLIIGTIYNGNKHFNHKTLYNNIKKYNPDIILWEQSDVFEPVFGLRTASVLKIWKPGIEQLALQKYSRFNKNCKILPFDTAIASRKKYLQQMEKTGKAFFDRLNNSNMSAADSIVYADYANKRNNFYEFIVDTSLQRINKADIIEISGNLYHLEEKYILPLGKKYIADTFLLKQFEDELKFWIARNNYMVKQIKNYATQYPGKRIIILTGLNHKYYLQEKLLEQKESAIKMIELESE